MALEGYYKICTNDDLHNEICAYLNKEEGLIKFRITNKHTEEEFFVGPISKDLVPLFKSSLDDVLWMQGKYHVLA